MIVSPLNEAVAVGRISSHRLSRLKVQEAPTSKDFTEATRAQLDRMALAMGERHMVIWLGAYAGLRLGESLGVNISDFIQDGTILRVSRQRDANGNLTDNLKARKPGEFRDVPVSAELWAKVSKAPRDPDGYLFAAGYRRGTYDAFNRARDLAGLPEDYRHCG